VLGVINSSPADLTPVFEAILEKAHRFCGAHFGALMMRDGTRFRAVAIRGVSGPFAEMARGGFEPGRNEPVGRLRRGEPFVHIPDKLRFAPQPRHPVATASVRLALARRLQRFDRAPDLRPYHTSRPSSSPRSSIRSCRRAAPISASAPCSRISKLAARPKCRAPKSYAPAIPYSRDHARPYRRRGRGLRPGSSGAQSMTTATRYRRGWLPLKRSSHSSKSPPTPEEPRPPLHAGVAPAAAGQKRRR
jgi:hypothetical protein